MQPAVSLLAGLIALSLAMLVLLAARPSLLRAAGGPILAVIAVFVLPAASLWGGFAVHLESSKTTEFCLSCHVMEPYGRSLLVDDESYLPANHYQNRRIDREHACFVCHTQYTMYGDLKAKWSGLRHVWIYYLGEVAEPIELYEPYRNRECLHCHAGARSYEELHEGELEMLASNELSCLECHDVAHAVTTLDEVEPWRAELPGDEP